MDSFDYFFESISDDVNNGIDEFLNNAIKNHHDMTMNNLDNYEMIKLLGCGTYGVVSEGRNKLTKERCAIKRLKIENETEGFPITALREIKLLQTLKHENIVNLKEVCYKNIHNPSKTFKMEFHLIFEYCLCDLHKVLSNRSQYSLNLLDKKTIMSQLLVGLNYIHSHKFMHRDLKPANILISYDGLVKIADFGLSRRLKTSIKPVYTENVVTMWYKGPELIMHINTYTPAIDIWSLGCIFSELWLRRPIFPGKVELEQLKLIMDQVGGINDDVWPGIERQLDSLKLKPSYRPSSLEANLKNDIESRSAVLLIVTMLSLDPRKRPRAADALAHIFFSEKPLSGKRVSFIRSRMA